MPTQIKFESPAVVEIAREAVVSEAGAEAVGVHLGQRQVDDTTTEMVFATRLAGYRGWCWSVLMSAPDGQEVPTITDVALIPGEKAVRAPAWQPWSTRVQPGDHGVSDLLPGSDQDMRLTPGYADEGAVEDWQDESKLLWWQLGLGRKHLLSNEGRSQIMHRWYSSPRGPNLEDEIDPSFSCQTCAFYLPLSGQIGNVFGACANYFAHDEGKVVSFDHGCSAHSELPRTNTAAVASAPYLDEFGFDLLGSSESQVQAEVSDQDTEESYPEPPESIGLDEPWSNEEERRESDDPRESSDDRNFGI